MDNNNLLMTNFIPYIYWNNYKLTYGDFSLCRVKNNKITYTFHFIFYNGNHSKFKTFYKNKSDMEVFFKNINQKFPGINMKFVPRNSDIFELLNSLFTLRKWGYYKLYKPYYSICMHPYIRYFFKLPKLNEIYISPILNKIDINRTSFVHPQLWFLKERKYNEITLDVSLSDNDFFYLTIIFSHCCYLKKIYLSEYLDFCAYIKNTYNIEPINDILENNKNKLNYLISLLMKNNKNINTIVSEFLSI